MRSSDLARLLTLAAIWGASFIFMRVAAPVLGAVWTAESRVAIAGLALALWCRWQRFDLNWREHARHYAVIGLLNSALPFLLFAWAARHMPAGYLGILNASAPMWGALFGAVAGVERFTLRKLAGLILGAMGVALTSYGGQQAELSTNFLLAVAACLAATAGYGLTGVYVKTRAQRLKPLGNATGSQITATLWLLPALAFSSPVGTISPTVAASVLALALLCSAAAYLLYFRLIQDVGPSKALTVTFLIPVFSMLWGALFLGEGITATMIAGCTLIIGGTALVVLARATR